MSIMTEPLPPMTALGRIMSGKRARIAAMEPNSYTDVPEPEARVWQSTASQIGRAFGRTFRSVRLDNGALRIWRVK